MILTLPRQTRVEETRVEEKYSRRISGVNFAAAAWKTFFDCWIEQENMMNSERVCARYFAEKSHFYESSETRHRGCFICQKKITIHKK